MAEEGSVCGGGTVTLTLEKVNPFHYLLIFVLYVDNVGISNYLV